MPMGFVGCFLLALSGQQVCFSGVTLMCADPGHFRTQSAVHKDFGENIPTCQSVCGRTLSCTNFGDDAAWRK